MTLLIRDQSRVDGSQQNHLNMSWVRIFYYVFFNIVFSPEIVATRSQQNHLNMSWVGKFFYYAFLNLVLPSEILTCREKRVFKQFHRFQTH